MKSEERAKEILSKIQEGTILLEDTCDEIHLDLQGNYYEVNKHTEHWLVQGITSTGFVLYNLDTQRTRRMSKEVMLMHLWESKKNGIKPIFTISKEVA